MILGTPGALWVLGLIPLVILLYMLRARRQPQVVPSTLLWERATRDLVARMPVRRLERSLLLLLQILAIAAIGLALARPSVALPGLVGDAVVLVIGTTASMQATDESPSRFVAARRDALELLRRLGPRQMAAVVEAGRQPRMIRDFTVDRAQLTSTIRSLRPADTSGSIDEAVALAAGLRAEGRPARVHVFGDHAPGDRRAQWHRVGRGAPNAAITSVSVRRDVRGAWKLLLRLEAFGGSFPSRMLTVALDGRPLAQRRMRLAPESPQVVVVDLGDASGIVTVQLQGRDALAADDRAVVAVGRGALPRILVVGGADPVLDAVLGAVPASSVTRTERVAPHEWGRADLVVLDGIEPVSLPAGAYLLIGTFGTNLPAQIEGAMPEQTIRTVTATHPVTRLVDLRGVRVAGGLALRPQAGSTLAEDDAPLVWAYEGRGIRAVVLPFALTQTDLPLHPAFPVLVANCVNWLAGGPEVAAGDAPVVFSGSRRRATLQRPDGAVTSIEARDGLFVLPPLDRVGIYHLRTEEWERRWIVSTVDARESDLTV
ncbi:MAG: vWA domain-containing protein, partial [Armatimonadota bacterium]